MVLEVSARIRIGAADGFDFLKRGSVGRSAGRSVAAALRAACTSRAAPSRLRLRSNWMEMRVRAERADRGHLVDAGDLAQPPLQRRRHRGGHGLRVGARPAGGDVDGGELDRGQARHRQEAVGDDATSSSPNASSVVPIGRSMKGREKFMRALLRGVGLRRPLAGLRSAAAAGARRARTRSMAR